MKDLMKYKQFVTGMVSVLAVSFVATCAQADEGVVRAKVSTGLSHYSSSTTTNGDISSNYATIGVGVSYIWPSNTFADFTTKRSFLDAAYVTQYIAAGQTTANQTFSRVENTVTVGMPLKNGLQGNAGLFFNETNFGFNQLGQTGQFSQKMQGLSAGIGKGIALAEGNAGSVGLNGGLALLNASYSDKSGVVSSSNLSYGISLGAAYNYVLNKTISLSADAKYQSYFIKYSNFSADERILSTSVSLIGQF